MDLNLKWLNPYELANSRSGLIYDVPRLDAVPETTGIYVFTRVHGRSVSPLYIGKALCLRSRIEQQLNNLKLMRAIEDARTGCRELHVAEFIGKAGQKAAKAIAIIESALSGNRVARCWLPENTIKLRRT